MERSRAACVREGRISVADLDETNARNGEGPLTFKSQAAPRCVPARTYVETRHFFLVRPAPFPETLIRADADLYLKQTIGARSAGLKPFTPEAYAEYRRCLQLPDTAHGICEDYGASVTIDLDHDRESLAKGQKIACEFLALWGAEGVIEKCFDPIAEWRNFSDNVSGHSLPCGHYIPEEAPELLIECALPFLRA